MTNYTIKIKETAQGKVEGLITNGGDETHFFELRSTVPAALYAHLHCTLEQNIGKENLETIAQFTAKNGGEPSASYKLPVLIAYRRMLKENKQEGTYTI